MTTGQAKYAVQFSAHGSRWVPKSLEFVYTLNWAEAIRAEWKARADTVGGDVLISKEEMTWECVGHNPTSWGLGFYRNGQMHNVIGSCLSSNRRRRVVLEHMECALDWSGDRTKSNRGDAGGGEVFRQEQ